MKVSRLFKFIFFLAGAFFYAPFALASSFCASGFSDTAVNGTWTSTGGSCGGNPTYSIGSENIQYETVFGFYRIDLTASCLYTGTDQYYLTPQFSTNFITGTWNANGGHGTAGTVTMGACGGGGGTTTPVAGSFVYPDASSSFAVIRNYSFLGSLSGFGLLSIVIGIPFGILVISLVIFLLIKLTDTIRKRI